MTAQEKEELLDTKERILGAATTLFALKGFEGTSMRDIAQTAQVNLASINYHFEHKQNLYLSVFEKNYDWLNSGIAAIAGNNAPSTKELAVKIYQFFLDNGPEFLNSFRIFLGGKLEFSEELADTCKGHMGPPGGEFLYQALKRDLPELKSELALRWAVSSIFTQLVHASIMLNCSVIKDNMGANGGVPHIFSPQFRERNIHALVDSIESFITTSPNYWDDLI